MRVTSNSKSDKLKVGSVVQDVRLVLFQSMTASSLTKHVSSGTPLRAAMLRGTLEETLFMHTWNIHCTGLHSAFLRFWDSQYWFCSLGVWQSVRPEVGRGWLVCCTTSYQRLPRNTGENHERRPLSSWYHARGTFSSAHNTIIIIIITYLLHLLT